MSESSTIDSAIANAFSNFTNLQSFLFSQLSISNQIFLIFPIRRFFIWGFSNNEQQKHQGKASFWWGVVWSLPNPLCPSLYPCLPPLLPPSIPSSLPPPSFPPPHIMALPSPCVEWFACGSSDIFGHPWIALDIDEHTLISADILRYAWIL